MPLTSKISIAQVVKAWQSQPLVAGSNPGRCAKTLSFGSWCEGFTSTILPGGDAPTSINAVHITYLVAHIREKRRATMTNDWSTEMDGQLRIDAKESTAGDDMSAR